MDDVTLEGMAYLAGRGSAPRDSMTSFHVSK